MRKSLIARSVALIGGALLSATTFAKQPNILVIWGDDIGWQNVSAYGMGTMGYTTPNIDSIGKQGIRFTDHYAQPSSTAGRASFITGQYPIRSGMTTVGQPGDPLGLQAKSPSLAEVMKVRVMRQVSLVRTTWAIGTNIYQLCMVLMSSTATFTT